MQSLPLPYCSVKVHLSPLYKCEKRKCVLYSIVTRAYKRPAKTNRLSQSATLHSTGNISAEVSENKNKAGHNSTHGKVSSLLFFPLKILLHTVYILNIFMWGRFETPLAKEALSLVMFMLTYLNEHIIIR